MSDLLDQVMVSLVHDNEITPVVYKYKDLFKNEDYVLIFYIFNMYSRNTTLDKHILESLITTNAPKWLDKNSIIKKSNKDNLTKDYLQTRTQNVLLTQHDEENILIAIVLDRYDELMNSKPTLDKEQVEIGLESEFKSNVNDTIITDLTSLLSNNLKYNNKVYTKTEMFDYLKDKITDIDASMNTRPTNSYKEDMENAYLDTLSNRIPCFKWNIGVDTVPVIKKSYMVSVIGFSKVGKTRFVIGEMVYPTLLSGKNVLILSGEMAKTDINSFIIIKHLYMKTGIRLGLDNCNAVLGISALLKKNHLKFDDIKNNIPDSLKEYTKVINKVRTIPNEVIESIIMTSNEVQGDGDFGIPYLLTKDDGIFNIKSFIRDIKSFISEHKIDMVVIDHMGLIEPDYKLSKTETMTQAYQMAKQIAVDKVNPTAVIAINHIDTTTEEKTLAGNNSNVGMTARAFNTNEAKKSADLELVLYRTEQSNREGQVILSVPYSRWESPPNDDIPLISDYLVSDFVVPGIQKGDYSEIE